MNRKHLFYTFLIQNSRQRLNIFFNFFRKIEEIPHRNFFDRNSIYVKYHRNILSHFNIKLYFIYFSTILCHSDFICFAKPMRFQRDAVYFFVLNFFFFVVCSQYFNRIYRCHYVSSVGSKSTNNGYYLLCYSTKYTMEPNIQTHIKSNREKKALKLKTKRKKISSKSE